MNIIEIRNLTKSYDDKIILDKFNLDIYEGEIIAIKGCSGKGKSTLLNIIGLIENFDSGELLIDGVSNVKPNSEKASKIIREKIGYLFQNFALVDNETVKFNLELAMKYIKLNKTDKKTKILDALKKVNLEGYENKEIYKLSGGEQQRVAIARLLIKPCKIILADEPTGSLDDKNKENILNLLKYLNTQGKTIVIVTHEDMATNIADRVIYL